MREHPPAWRRTEILPLPGDEGDTLDAEIAKAIRRDNRLTLSELMAKNCVVQQRNYGVDFCLSDYCPFCEADAWQRWDEANRRGVMTLF